MLKIVLWILLKYWKRMLLWIHLMTLLWEVILLWNMLELRKIMWNKRRWRRVVRNHLTKMKFKKKSFLEKKMKKKNKKFLQRRKKKKTKIIKNWKIKIYFLLWRKKRKERNMMVMWMGVTWRGVGNIKASYQNKEVFKDKKKKKKRKRRCKISMTLETTFCLAQKQL